MTYQVQHKDGQHFHFQTADDVATFMWGRDFAVYRIYKDGRRFLWMSGDLAEFRVALEAF